MRGLAWLLGRRVAKGSLTGWRGAIVCLGACWVGWSACRFRLACATWVWVGSKVGLADALGDGRGALLRERLDLAT